MPYMTVSLNLTDDQLNQALHSLGPFGVVLEAPGVNLYRVADAIANGGPLKIFSTGCIRDTRPDALMSDGWDTFFLAKWINAHPGSTLDVVEIEPKSIELCQGLLRQHGLHNNVTFWEDDSLKYMAKWSFTPDLMVLDTCEGLEHGLEEFKAAVKHNPKAIVMDDFETKVSLAAEYAHSQNIPVQRIDRYTAFKIR